jgi:curved DNA-binding protein CbpA
MSVSIKVMHSLRVLGLPPDATASEIRSAFRRLARTCHPDVVGRQGARKFEQITGAYTFLKNLTQEELRREKIQKEGLQKEGAYRDDFSATSKASAASAPPKAFRWGWKKWKKALTWRQKREERLNAEKERQERFAREMEEKIKQTREASIENILTRGEKAVENLLTLAEQENQNCNAQDLLLRLSSDIPQVRHLALSRLGTLVNRAELFDATVRLLQKWDIDDKTARLVASLPFEPENHQALAKKLADRAAALPHLLLAHLLRLQSPSLDRELLERYLQKATPSGIAWILRSWPQGPFVSAPILRDLLSHKSEVVLVPLLSMMKQRSVPCPDWGRQQLAAHLSHPNVAVRVWAKALLN